MPTFGQTDTTGYSAVWDIESYIRFGRFQAPENGLLESITFRSTVTTTPKDAYCALYEDGDGIADLNVARLGVTGVVSCTDGWHTAIFASKPVLAAGTWYRFGVFSMLASGEHYLWAIAGPGSPDRIYSVASSQTFPDPSGALTAADYRICAYGTYIKSGGPLTPSIPSKMLSIGAI